MVREKNAAHELDISESELDARLARFDAFPTKEQRAGGLLGASAAWMLALSLVGMFASLELIMAEKSKLTAPDTDLACDLNSLIGCGKWIGSWQNALFFGISNSVLGLAFFAGVAALALVLLTGGRFGKLLWQALCVAMMLAIVWVLWFQYQSFIVARSICPYCFVTWIATIPLAVLVWARALQAGHWGKRVEPFGRVLVRNRFIVIAAWYAALAIFTLVWFWDTWVRIF